jgi:hypothetical protein
MFDAMYGGMYFVGVCDLPLIIVTPSAAGQGLLHFVCLHVHMLIHPHYLQDSMKIHADSSIGLRQCSMPSVTARGSFLRPSLVMSIVGRHLRAPILPLQ